MGRVRGNHTEAGGGGISGAPGFLKRAFDKAHYDFEIVRQQAETFLERFHEPEVEEEPNYLSLAASMERELADTLKDMEEKLTDAKADVEKAPTDAL